MFVAIAKVANSNEYAIVKKRMSIRNALIMKKIINDVHPQYNQGS